ncbi:MAG: alpha-2-macroglobulin family protein [Candidatus Omnitrophota bacterium]
MKKICKYSAFGLLLLFFSGTCLASDIKKADELFSKGTYQEALKEYESVFKENADAEIHWKAFFRICESLAHLYRYGEAAQKLISTPTPAQTLHSARILILKTEMLTNFLERYSFTQRGDAIDEEKDGDVFRLTPAEIKDEIRLAYRQLWELRNSLAQMDMAQEGYFFNIKNVDFGMYPTLFDYLIFSFSDFLLNTETEYANDGAAKPKADLLSAEEFNLPVNLEDPPALLAAELIGEAGRFNQERRLEAAERWKIKRLLLPLEYTNLFDLRDLAQDKALYDDEDSKEYRRRAKDILLKWMEEFNTNNAKANAALEAALILKDTDKLVEAVKLCEKIEKDFADTDFCYHAQALRSQIQMPACQLQVKTAMPPGAGAFTITTKNLKKVYFRIYPVEPRELKQEYISWKISSRYKADFNGWSDLFNPNWFYLDRNKNWLQSYLPGKTPYKEWGSETTDRGDYAYVTNTIDPPQLQAGIYLVLACADKSFEIGGQLFSACFLNITDFVLIGTAGFTTKTYDACFDFVEGSGQAGIDDEGFRFYALNAKTGKPQDNVDLDAYTSLSYPQSKENNFNLITDKEGYAYISLPVCVAPRTTNNRYSVDPLAKSGNSFSYWPRCLSLDFAPPNPIELFIETDRPIYRPGHKVQAKVIAVRRTPQGFAALTGAKEVKFTVYDPIHEDFLRESVKLNEFGSSDLSFEIPQGRLLGRYGLRAVCVDGHFSNSVDVYFSVEEYKQPEFEITIKPAAQAWKYNEPVEIKGQVSYYFGGPVPEAAIKYRIKRQAYIPWCYRYWFEQDYKSSAQEIATGDLKTDKEGNFIIPFIPTPGSQEYGGNIPDIAEFLVEVEARDSGGRTIQAQQSYKSGKNAVYLTIEPKKGFSLEDEAIEIDSKRLSLNDTAMPGISSYEVFTLADTPAKPLTELADNQWGYQGWTPPLDFQLKGVLNDKLVAQGEVQHDEEGKAAIKLSPLPQGAYRITIKSRDEWAADVEQAKIFVVAKNTQEAVPVKAASVMLAEKNEYKIKDTARFIFGSALGSGTYHIELWTGKHFLSRRLIDNNQQVRLIEIPVTEEMKGGFTLRWFGVKELNIYNGQATVAVPWEEKKLNISLEPFDKELTPGKEAGWGVKVSDSKNMPAESEVLALMYDRSLEYYITSKNPWLDSLYALRDTPGFWSWSYPARNQFVAIVPVVRGTLWKLLGFFRQGPKEYNPPGLRTSRMWARGEYYGRTLSKGMDINYEWYALDEAVTQGARMCESGEGKYEEAAKKIETRKEFADTAFFKPHIFTTSENGSAQFSFTSPEQLTSWKIKLFAFTKDIKEGTLTEEAVTRKDLMVRADIPRFFREKDKGMVTAIVHNESEQPVEGELFIDIIENNEIINEKLKLGSNKRNFKIEPHSLGSFNWMIEIPEGVSTYKVKVVAVTDKLSDAEERQLPILPSRQRLIESAFTTLSGSESKSLEISIKDDATRINESMVLQVEPQLALSILNTIPFLVEYPHECVEQILNKYVPLSIVNEVYKKYPAIQEAVSKIPERKTVTAPWEKDDPRRLITLMETPWVLESEGGQPASIIDLLDPKIVESQKAINFNKLKKAQLANGAFPWWPGGEPDSYMTLYVLSGLAEAMNYGVEVPKDIIQGALRYVNNEIPYILKPQERDLALISFAAYVVTSYPAGEFSEAKKGHEAAKSWLVFLENHIDEMTPLSKAYLSFTYLRLGDKKKAESLLDMAMDGAREDPVAGVYWAPEKYSWVWYSDTVEKHAFFLRALQKLRPEDKRIPGMIQWLLFNRKGTVWKSTKASVAAVYCLLDYLNQRGALSADETFTVKWGSKTYSEVIKADDWLNEPIRWQQTGFDITPEMNKALIEKEGPGLAFAGMTWTYSTDEIPQASTPGMLELDRKFYRRIKEGDFYHLKLINSGEEVSVGDQIEVQLKINTRSQFEYMHLKDLKAAGFEAEILLSGWNYDQLHFYEEPRDSLTNFFIGWLPHGEYILRYRLKPTKPGTYRIGSATLQSMYAPDMAAHSAGFIIKVIEQKIKK